MSKFSVGDEVFVRFVVKRVHEGDLPPSVQLETIRENPGTDGMKSGVTLCEDLVEIGLPPSHYSAFPEGEAPLGALWKKRTRYDLFIPGRVFVALIVLFCLASIPWSDLFRELSK